MDEIARVGRWAVREGLTGDFGVGRVGPKHSHRPLEGGTAMLSSEQEKEGENSEISRRKFCRSTRHGCACGMMMLYESFRMPHSL